MRKLLLFLLPALLLAATIPARVADAADPVAQALAWLKTQQRTDGSFGGAAVTSDVVYTLALLGENPDGATWTGTTGKSALDALELQTPSYVVNHDPGYLGKVARAVAAAGADPRNFAGLDLIALINANYDPATGRYHPAWLFRHSLAMEALYRAGAPVPQGAVNAALNAQLPGGGWFWSFDGAQADVDTTGRVMQVLAAFSGVRCGSAFGRAATYLAAGQLATGGWGVTASVAPANANSTALAVAGLRAAGIDPQSAAYVKAGLGAVDTLLTYQEPTGAFVYIQQAGKEEVRLVATLDALNALSQSLTVPSLCRPAYLPVLFRQ